MPTTSHHGALLVSRAGRPTAAPDVSPKPTTAKLAADTPLPKPQNQLPDKDPSILAVPHATS